MSTPKNALQTIASICSTEPRTLTDGNNFLDAIDGIAATLYGTPNAEIGEKVREAVTTREDNPRPKTLPQVKERLTKIGAMIPTVAAAPSGNRLSVPGSPMTDAMTSDSALMDRYSTLKGPDRFTFFQANRDALVREDKRRADEARTALHADVVSQYLSLTGPARADFYEKHQAELWQAHRARSKRA